MNNYNFSVSTVVFAIVASLVAVSAHAGGDTKPLERNKTLVSNLTMFALDESIPGAAQIKGGTLQIDRAAGRITVSLLRPVTCTAPALCTMKLQLPVTLTFTLTGLRYEDCGARVFTGTSLPSFTGVTRTVTIEDRSHESGCASMGEQTPTAVVIESTNGIGSPVTTSQLQAEPLAPLAN